MRIIYWKTVRNESPAEYRERFMAAVQEGLEDIEAGRLLEDEEVTRILDEEFGPLSKKPTRPVGYSSPDR
jgi:predicted transcriptional regulator